MTRTVSPSPELEPCPFIWCEGKPIVVGHCLSSKGVPNEFVAGCPDCDLFSPQCVTAEEAIALWNARRPQAEIARLTMVSGEAMAAATYSLHHNPNCPKPYLVRLPRGTLDLKKYAETNDANWLRPDRR